MFIRQSLGSRRPQNLHFNRQVSEKENNQKNLNRSKRSPRLGNVEGCFLIKPLGQTKNYNTNVNIQCKDYKSVNDFRTRINSGRVHDTLRMQSPVLKDKKPSKSITNTNQFCQLYGNSILTQHQLSPTIKQKFLTAHEITPQLRARMLDWMVEVMKSYKFMNKTYFAGVEIMDRFFAESKERVKVSELHLVGVVAMYMATKMEEVFPLKLKTVYEKIVHKKIDTAELAEMQGKMFKVLSYKTNSWTIFDLAMLQFHSLYQPTTQPQTQPQFQQTASLISKYIMYDYPLYTSYPIQSFSKVITKITSQLCHLQPKVDDVDEDCYREVVRCCREFRDNNKGLGNVVKFGDAEVVRQVQKFAEEGGWKIMGHGGWK